VKLENLAGGEEESWGRKSCVRSAQPQDRDNNVVKKEFERVGKAANVTCSAALMKTTFIV